MKLNLILLHLIFCIINIFRNISPPKYISHNIDYIYDSKGYILKLKEWVTLDTFVLTTNLSDSIILDYCLNKEGIIFKNLGGEEVRKAQILHLTHQIMICRKLKIRYILPSVDVKVLIYYYLVSYQKRRKCY